MTRTDIAKELRRFTGAGTISRTQLAEFLGEKNRSRVRNKYLLGLEAIGGRRYLITDVADRLKCSCELMGEEDDDH